ncbi:hypothetical protein JX266_006275 [Neoarthrinium moseri]|nr:hypothetical protein JX266_006275 [Neoarthrinium moseri]
MWLLRGGQEIYPLIQLLALVDIVRGQADASPSTAGGDATKTTATTPTVQPTCESRTVNYITHTLPQQCLTSAPSSVAPSSESSVTVSQTASSPAESTAAATVADEEEHELDSDGNDLSTGAFMSFEEWKKKQLEKSGQENLENRPRKSHEDRGEAPGEDYGSFGDDGEISLDFDAYSAEKISEITSATKPSQKEKEREDAIEKVSREEGLPHVHRSKDAGKTCKERFSYSSFDAGATVLKTSHGAKNSKAILVENKDSYMLMECGTENKFFIVELSDDILVDTVVLANFEFFSSMVRQFRVSVSDRYPVKLDKWNILGEYQARNSRDIQPFLIENPQIWARYLRVEILSHYGKEYYCPLSLIRVHGTRMLDSWKEADPSDLEGDFEAEGETTKSLESPEETLDPEVEVVVDEPQTPEQTQPENHTVTIHQSAVIPVWDKSYFQHRFQPDATCGLDETPDRPSQTHSGEDKERNAAPARPQPVATAEQTGQTIASPTSHSPETSTTDSPAVASASSRENSSASAITTTPTDVGSPASASPTPSNTTQTPASKSTTVSAKPSNTHVVKNKSGASTSLKPPSSKSSHPKVSGASSSRNKTSTVTSSSTAASPTVQDSFFKQLTKRLQSLESNTTLSMQYIESQSKFLQEALAKLERRQVSKVDSFLDTLNKTVLSELREVRTQYDQIWQSTVIALESQREQSEREIVALSTRLSLLADEVVFQKRMAIIQSILTLGCLVLVVFSRGLASAGLELYYPSQFLGSTSRLASPAYPSTPKAVSRRAQRDSTPLRESIEDRNGITPERGLSVDRDANPTPPRSRTGHSPTPEPRPQRHLSLPENRRPSPSRAVSETTGLECYQPPTPASLDAGYDSEPPDLSSAPREGDYFSRPSDSANDSANSYRESTPATADDETHPLTTFNNTHASESRQTSSTEADDDESLSAATTTTAAYAGDSGAPQPHRGAARPPMSHVGSSRKPLPALPEDEDPE